MPQSRKNPNRQAGGRKSARTRDESDEFAAQEIDPKFHDIWEAVRWTLKVPPGRYKAEVFSEWAHDHPREIAAMRSGDEKKATRAFEKLEKHCVRVADKARKDLAAKNWDHLATFEPLIQEQLEDCARDTDRPEYDPAQLEMFLRGEQFEEAPF